MILPQGPDQFVNAEMLAEQGAGRRLLADASHRDAARATEIAAMPAPRQVIPTLTKFALAAA